MGLRLLSVLFYGNNLPKSDLVSGNKPFHSGVAENLISVWYKSSCRLAFLHVAVQLGLRYTSFIVLPLLNILW